MKSRDSHPLEPELAPLRADLFARAKLLGPLKQQMYDEGRFSGFVNALDPLSPHCAVSEETAREWHATAIKYLDEWAARQ